MTERQMQDTIENTEYSKFQRMRHGIKPWHIVFAFAAALVLLMVVIWRVADLVDPVPVPTATPTPKPTLHIVTYTPLPMPSQTVVPTDTPEPVRRSGVVNADVWVLMAPDGDTFACALLAGSEVVILDEQDGYGLVEHQPGGQALIRGWVPMQYITVRP